MAAYPINRRTRKPLPRVVLRLEWDVRAHDWVFRIGTLRVSVDPDLTNDLPEGGEGQGVTIYDDCTYAVVTLCTTDACGCYGVPVSEGRI